MFHHLSLSTQSLTNQNAINFLPKSFSSFHFFKIFNIFLTARTESVFACFPLKFRNTSERAFSKAAGRGKYDRAVLREKLIFHWKFSQSGFSCRHQRFPISPRCTQTSNKSVFFSQQRVDVNLRQ